MVYACIMFDTCRQFDCLCSSYEGLSADNFADAGFDISNATSCDHPAADGCCEWGFFRRRQIVGWDLGEFSVRSGWTEKCTAETAKVCSLGTQPSDEGDLSAARNARCVPAAPAKALSDTGSPFATPPERHAGMSRSTQFLANSGPRLVLLGAALLIGVVYWSRLASSSGEALGLL